MSSKLPRIVIVGATSAIAEHCARIWIKKSPADLVLVGRNLAKTDRVAADLLVRNPECRVKCLLVDFLIPAQIEACVNEIVKEGMPDIVLIAHGSLSDQQRCQSELGLCSEALSINGVSPVLFAEAFAFHMQNVGKGRLAMISSVAGDRGRKSNYVYGAAKGLVSRYAQGLQHRMANTGLRVVLIKPGPTDTPMTAHLKQKGSRLANVEAVARQIVSGLDRGKPVIYVPSKWALIMMVVRHLPSAIFNRLNL